MTINLLDLLPLLLIGAIRARNEAWGRRQWNHRRWRNYVSAGGSLQLEVGDDYLLLEDEGKLLFEDWE